MPLKDQSPSSPLERFRDVVLGRPRDVEPSERRREVRWPAHGPAVVVWRTIEGEHRERVDLIGMSQRGLSFRSLHRLEVGEVIWIADESGLHFEAVVRHLEPDPDGYNVGVELRKRLTDFDDNPVPAAKAV